MSGNNDAVAQVTEQEKDFYMIQLMKLRKEFYLFEMAALLLNVNPQKIRLIKHNESDKAGKPMLVNSYVDPENKEQTIQRPHPKNAFYQELRKAMIDAVDYGDIELVGDALDNFIRCQQNNMDFNRSTGKCAGDFTTLNRYAVQAWVEKFNFETNFFEAKKPAELPLPRYLDKNHPEHSLELGIAIEAWERFSDLGITHPKRYLQEWFKEQYTSLSNEAKIRIAEMINWNKKGGATSNAYTKATYQQALDKEITTFSTQPKQ
jgi:hypothetical protein